MKKFVDEIVVKDSDLARDIIQALESCPISGTCYEVVVKEKVCRDDMVVDGLPRLMSILTIYRCEPMV